MTTTFQTTPHVPYNGDRHIGLELQRLIARFGIRSAIESGLWSGHTTRALRALVPGRVTSLDVTLAHLDDEFGADARWALLDLGIELVLGNSKDTLGGVLSEWSDRDFPVLFYLDAHGEGNPIREELAAIGVEPRCRDRCVVVLHDVIVPGKPWGYNWVQFGAEPEPLGYDVIADLLPAIYPSGFQYHFNDVAEGCQRGTLYIYAIS